MTHVRLEADFEALETRSHVSSSPCGLHTGAPEGVSQGHGDPLRTHGAFVPMTSWALSLATLAF